MEPGEHWDWGSVLYGLYDETDGSDEKFLQIADELREEYQKGLIGSDDAPPGNIGTDVFRLRNGGG